MVDDKRVAKFIISLDEQGARIDEFAARANQSLEKAGKGAGGFADILKTGIGTAAGFLAARALPAMGRAISDAVNRTSEVASLQTGFKNLTAAQGLNADVMITKLRPAMRGLISDQDLMQSTNTALTLGIVQSEDQWANLSGAALKLGRAVGITATHALESLSIGLGRQSKLVLDNLGVIVDAEGAYARYAAKLGKAASELSEAEKKQAFLEEATKKIIETANRAGEAQLTLGDYVQRGTVMLSNWTDKVLTGINESPRFNSALQTMAGLFSDNEGFGDDFADVLVEIAESGADAALVIARIIDKLAGLEEKLPVLKAFGLVAADALKLPGELAYVFGLVERYGDAVKLSAAGQQEFLDMLAQTGPVATTVRHELKQTYDEFERDSKLHGDHADKVKLSQKALEALAYKGLDPTLARLQQLTDLGAGKLAPFIEELASDTRVAFWRLVQFDNALAGMVTGPAAGAPELIDSLDRAMERYGVRLPDVSREMAQLNMLWESGKVPAKQMAEIVQRQWEELDRLGVLTPEVKEQLKLLAAETGKAAGQTVDWNSALLDVFDTIRTGKQWLDNLIGSVVKFFGSLINGQGPLSAFQSSLGGIGGLLGSIGGTGGGIAGNVLGALGAGGPLAGLFGGGAAAAAPPVAAAGGAAAWGSGAAPAYASIFPGAGTAATGGGIFGGLGGALGGLFSNPLTGIAAGVGLGGFGLYKLLTKSTKEARTERQTDIFGAFKVPKSVLDSLAELSIKATKAGRELPDTIASIVGFDDVIKATGITTASQFSSAMNKGDEAIQRFKEGLITGAEAAEFFGTDSLGIMQKAAHELGGTAVDEFARMIDKAKEAGVKIPEEFARMASLSKDEIAGIADALGAALSSNADAVNRFASSFTEGLGGDAAKLLSSQFNSTAAEMRAGGAGILEILEKFKPTLDAANEAGVGLGGQFAFLQTLSSKLADEGVAKLVDRQGALNDMLRNTSDLGLLDQKTFDLFARNAVQGFDDLSESLGSGNLALRVQGPLLAGLRDIAAQYGFKLDDATQAIINQAGELGAIPPEAEPINTILGDMRLILLGIAEVFGVDLPDSVKRFRDRAKDQADKAAKDVKDPMTGAAKEIQDAFDDLKFDGFDVIRHRREDRIPHLAGGGIVQRPTFALLGESGPEAVVPLSRGIGGNMTVTVRFKGANDSRTAKLLKSLLQIDVEQGISANRAEAFE